MSRSDGSTADYYVLPEGATQLQDLISHRNMNAQIGEITRACYRYGLASHSDMLRDAKKIRFYAQAEVERLEKLGQTEQDAHIGYKDVEPSHIISDIPSWDEAPEWAMWLSLDREGAYWMEREPVENSRGDGYMWPSHGNCESHDDIARPMQKIKRPTSQSK